MTIQDVKIVKLIIKARLLSARNYFYRKLDRITRIELVIFVCALIGVFLHRINLKLYWLLNGGTAEEAWGFFLQIILFLYLVSFFSVFSFTKKSLQKTTNAQLILLPFSSEQFTIVKLFEILFPLSVIYILVVGIVLIFGFKTDVQLWGTLYLLVKSFALVLASQLTGVATAVVLAEQKGLENRLNRMLLLVILVLVNFLFIINFDSVFRYSLYFFWMFIGSALFIPHVLTYWSINVQLKYSPHAFIRTRKNSTLFPLKRIIDWFIMPVPRVLKPIVKKDIIFATRFYKSYLLTFFILLISSIIGLIAIKDAKNAAGWLVFINVLGCYWLTNLSFKFNEEAVEIFAVIKTLNLNAKQYWWGKFFTSILPIFWILFLSYLSFGFLFKFPILLFGQSFFISLWLCFTLVFFQTNFSLYSYPYARYAPLWYNMYIVLAVLFFTILLFPPLTIAFLLLGYLAIFRVLGRIKSLEVY